MNSFLCDGTGHWLHLRNAGMKELVNQLLPGELAEHERKAVIFSHGVFTAYPFQANTYGLPREVIMECLLGLLKAKHPEDFGQKRRHRTARVIFWNGSCARSAKASPNISWSPTTRSCSASTSPN